MYERNYECSTSRAMGWGTNTGSNIAYAIITGALIYLALSGGEPKKEVEQPVKAQSQIEQIVNQSDLK